MAWPNDVNLKTGIPQHPPSRSTAWLYDSWSHAPFSPVRPNASSSWCSEVFICYSGLAGSQPNAGIPPSFWGSPLHLDYIHKTCIHPLRGYSSPDVRTRPGLLLDNVLPHRSDPLTPRHARTKAGTCISKAKTPVRSFSSSSNANAVLSMR